MVQYDLYEPVAIAYGWDKKDPLGMKVPKDVGKPTGRVNSKPAVVLPPADATTGISKEELEIIRAEELRAVLSNKPKSKNVSAKQQPKPLLKPKPPRKRLLPRQPKPLRKKPRLRQKLLKQPKLRLPKI